MKKWLFLLTLLTLPFCDAWSQSQMEMNREASQSFVKVNTQLTKLYEKLLVKSDNEGKEKLKTAQQNWIAFREAEAAYLADGEARGGSMEPMVYSYAQRDLTNGRIAHFKKLLAGVNP